MPEYKDDGITPESSSLLAAFSLIEKLIGSGAALAVSTPGYGGAAEAVFKMCVGNKLGIKIESPFDADALLCCAYGSFIVELADNAHVPSTNESVTCCLFGTTCETYTLDACGEHIDLDKLQAAWETPLESVFPYRKSGKTLDALSFDEASANTHIVKTSCKLAHPRVIIPVFPGTNCEYDTARAFERAGAVAECFVINNLTPSAIAESAREFARRIKNSQIIMIPGGFSAADEPDGSAKFITAFFRAPEVSEAVREHLQARDGLMLGICNGFQALVKLGLVPFGDIRPMDEHCPTLTFNTIGRHQSRLVRTRIASTLSPWLSKCKAGDIHTIAISHGEGRFVASNELLDSLIKKGQVATQYVDENGIPSMSLEVNPNGSVLAIEGITSPDGRIFGKMGHSERAGEGLYQNVSGNSYQALFEGGVAYFSE